MSGMTSKRKGKIGEIAAAKELERLFGCEARRGQQFAGGTDSPDVTHSIHGVHVEVKRTEKLRLYHAVEQATDEGGGKIPLVLHKANRKPWLAIVPLDDLPALATVLYLTLADQ